MPARHLYIHVPFCARRCSYCDFSIAVRSITPVAEYLVALGTELARVAPDLGSGPLDTVYLGGGTPSRLGGSGVAEVLSLVRAVAPIADDAEVTIEANPDDVDDVTAAQWKRAGVNRVSLGSQSFDDSVLQWMHRTHDASQIVRAVETIRRTGITNISLDLIFSVPADLGRSWDRDIAALLALEPSHVSLYGLTIEDRTPVARWKDRGAVVEGTEDKYEEEFLYADWTLSRAGFAHYEVSNFCRPGMQSRHNSAYWSGAAYVGVGPSAHSFDGQNRSWNVRNYSDWVRRLAAGQTVVEGRETLTDDNRRAEDIYLGLRTDAGLAIGPADREVADLWAGAGWAVQTGGVLRLTPLGWLRLDSLAAGLAARRAPKRPSAMSPTPSHCYI